MVFAHKTPRIEYVLFVAKFYSNILKFRRTFFLVSHFIIAIGYRTEK